MYRCVDCDCIFEEPIVQRMSYEDFYGVSSMFDTSTPMELNVCPNCSSEYIEENFELKEYDENDE